MSMQVRRLSHGLGASVTGINLAKISDAQFKEIEAVWLEHQVLAFHDQNLSPAEQIAFGRRFGELDRHDLIPFYQLPDYPEIFQITNLKIGGKVSETKDTGRLWHSDYQHTLRPARATLLYCKEIPPVGGDTMFTNMYMAYDTLSDALKRVLDQLEAVQDFQAFMDKYHKNRTQSEVAEMRKLNPPVAQPVVRVHPETGRKALFVSEMQTTNFVGMSAEESAGLLQYLFRHSVLPEFTHRHKWTPGDLVIWDNRCTMHMAVPDYTHDQTRHMHRLTVLGTPCGRSLNA